MPTRAKTIMLASGCRIGQDRRRRGVFMRVILAWRVGESRPPAPAFGHDNAIYKSDSRESLL
jgi:hypothetical protein